MLTLSLCRPMTWTGFSLRLLHAHRSRAKQQPLQQYHKRTVSNGQSQQGGGRDNLPGRIGMATVFIGGAAAYLYYTNYGKSTSTSDREKEQTRTPSKLSIGGDFKLTDQNGQVRSSVEWRGDWILLYFGFTRCPDVCPEELDKMCDVIKLLKEQPKAKALHPVFVTVDPSRDNVQEVKDYLAEFPADILGLTGSEEDVMAVCRAYRVYFTAGPRDHEGNYIVDHTIIQYLINPDGEVVAFFVQNNTAEDIAKRIREKMSSARSSD